MILDNSASMYYPQVENLTIDSLNKIGFSVLAIAALMNVLKRQRDAVGLSIYSDGYNYYAPEKGSERHFQMLLAQLSDIGMAKNPPKETKTYTYLHQIAEKIKRRSLIFLFTDMFQTEKNDDELFEALRHLKYNKHDVVLFHPMDKQHELFFNFENTPKRFVDVETGEHLDLYADNIKDAYNERITTYLSDIKMKCAQYKINYVDIDIQRDFSTVLNTFLVERNKFL